MVGLDIQEYERQEADYLSLCVLASGSKGNACYIASNNSAILIDAGLSGKEIERRMQLKGLLSEKLTALIVTHEHSDHIRGIGVLARRFNLPVYINKKTHAKAQDKIGKIEDIRFFESGTGFSINELKIHPFSISHDAQDPVGIKISYKEKAVGIATDLGIATAVVKEYLRGCNLVVVEANHDPVMLANGPYPWPLKQRVKSRVGHLSNEDSIELILEIKTDSLKHIILGHISKENNTPAKALCTVVDRLNGNDINVIVASQDCVSDLIKL